MTELTSKSLPKARSRWLQVQPRWPTEASRILTKR